MNLTFAISIPPPLFFIFSPPSQLVGLLSVVTVQLSSQTGPPPLSAYRSGEAGRATAQQSLPILIARPLVTRPMDYHSLLFFYYSIYFIPFLISRAAPVPLPLVDPRPY